MSFSLKALFVAIIYHLCAPPISCAVIDSRPQDTALGRTLAGVRDVLNDEASSANLTPAKDAFLVEQVRISGNTLISTADLLGKMPAKYAEYEIDPATGEPKREPITGVSFPAKHTYDFRVLHEIILRPGEERSVPLETVQGLTAYILSKYKDRGYAGIYVYVPAETVEGSAKLKNDILEIEIIEGRVAEIMVERYDLQDPNQRLLDPDKKRLDPEKKRGYLKSSVLKSWSPAKEGDAIKTKHLDDFVRLLNLNPDRHIRHHVSRSQEPNALNLSYDIYEADPWHWYLQADNAGTRDRQWAPRVAVVNTDLTGIDDRFSAVYQAPWEKDIEDEYSVFGSYDFPLFRPRLRLGVYAGYSQFDITPEGGAGVNFLGNGSFYGTVLSYNVLQIGGWFVDAT
ncbi:MAG: hypothetical protein PVJ86_13925, partial [Phycisphaerales bacterium]